MLEVLLLGGSLLALGLLFAVLLVVLLYRANVAASDRQEKALEIVRDLAREAADNHRRALEQLALLKGLHPHHAAPEKFTPSGASWKVHDELERVLRENQKVTPATVEEAEIGRDREETYTLAQEFFGARPTPLETEHPIAETKP